MSKNLTGPEFLQALHKSVKTVVDDFAAKAEALKKAESGEIGVLQKKSPKSKLHKDMPINDPQGGVGGMDNISMAEKSAKKAEPNTFVNYSDRPGVVPEDRKLQTPDKSYEKASGGEIKGNAPKMEKASPNPDVSQRAGNLMDQMLQSKKPKLPHLPANTPSVNLASVGQPHAKPAQGVQTMTERVASKMPAGGPKLPKTNNPFAKGEPAPGLKKDIVPYGLASAGGAMQAGPPKAPMPRMTSGEHGGGLPHAGPKPPKPSMDTVAAAPSVGMAKNDVIPTSVPFSMSQEKCLLCGSPLDKDMCGY